MQNWTFPPLMPRSSVDVKLSCCEWVQAVMLPFKDFQWPEEENHEPRPLREEVPIHTAVGLEHGSCLLPPRNSLVSCLLCELGCMN